MTYRLANHAEFALMAYRITFRVFTDTGRSFQVIRTVDRWSSKEGPLAAGESVTDSFTIGARDQRGPIGIFAVVPRLTFIEFPGGKRFSEHGEEQASIFSGARQDFLEGNRELLRFYLAKGPEALQEALREDSACTGPFCRLAIQGPLSSGKIAARVIAAKIYRAEGVQAAIEEISRVSALELP